DRRRQAGATDRGRQPAIGRPRATPRHRRALSRSQGQPAVRAPLGRARRHREPHRRRAYAVQRRGPRVQRVHQERAGRGLRAGVRLPAPAVLRGAGGGEEGAEGGLRDAGDAAAVAELSRYLRLVKSGEEILVTERRGIDEPETAHAKTSFSNLITP